MSLISLRNINITFDGPKILEGLSLDIHKGQRICILGRNGSGKSTLMRIINGEIKPDSGEIIVDPGLKVSYLAQDVPENITGSAFDVVAAGAGRIGESLAEYHHQLECPTDDDLLHTLQHELTEHDGWQIEAVINRVLEQVQVKPDVEFASLSGGIRRRVRPYGRTAWRRALAWCWRALGRLDREKIDSTCPAPDPGVSRRCDPP